MLINSWDQNKFQLYKMKVYNRSLVIHSESVSHSSVKDVNYKASNNIEGCVKPATPFRFNDKWIVYHCTTCCTEQHLPGL